MVDKLLVNLFTDNMILTELISSVFAARRDHLFSFDFSDACRVIFSLVDVAEVVQLVICDAIGHLL